jgi:hypothetical protein
MEVILFSVELASPTKIVFLSLVFLKPTKVNLANESF